MTTQDDTTISPEQHATLVAIALRGGRASSSEVAVEVGEPTRNVASRLVGLRNRGLLAGEDETFTLTLAGQRVADERDDNLLDEVLAGAQRDNADWRAVTSLAAFILRGRGIEVAIAPAEEPGTWQASTITAGATYPETHGPVTVTQLRTALPSRLWQLARRRMNQQATDALRRAADAAQNGDPDASRALASNAAALLAELTD